MAVSFRPYQVKEDYHRVSNFLIRHYQPDNKDGNWLQPSWEYMHFHPWANAAALAKTGLWETPHEIVGVVNAFPGAQKACFQLHPTHQTPELCSEMLAYAEATFCERTQEDGQRVLTAIVNENHRALADLVQARGYQRKDERSFPLCQMVIPDPFPSITLPKGFRLTSLAEEPDWAKVNRVLWRGFDHPSAPPASEKDLEERRIMFDTPTARRDLKIAVAAPDGQFAAICGMFYVEANRYAVVEPAATDPDYRRMGLGRAAVLEGVRRCAELGARVVYVGSDQPFYLALGFTPIKTDVCWENVREDVKKAPQTSRPDHT